MSLQNPNFHKMKQNPKTKQSSCAGFCGLPSPRLAGAGFAQKLPSLQTAPLKTSISTEAESARLWEPRQAGRELLSGADELMALLPWDFWHEGSGQLWKQLSFS